MASHRAGHGQGRRFERALPFNEPQDFDCRHHDSAPPAVVPALLAARAQARRHLHGAESTGHRARRKILRCSMRIFTCGSNRRMSKLYAAGGVSLHRARARRAHAARWWWSPRSRCSGPNRRSCSRTARRKDVELQVQANVKGAAGRVRDPSARQVGASPRRSERFRLDRRPTMQASRSPSSSRRRPATPKACWKRAATVGDQNIVSRNGDHQLSAHSAAGSVSSGPDETGARRRPPFRPRRSAM